MEGLTEISQIIGPIGVLVVIVAWALISRRHGNGQTDRYQVVVAKLDALRDDMSEVKTDVRELRSSLVRHLEDHANT